MGKKTSKGWRMQMTFYTDTTGVLICAPDGINLDHSSVLAHGSSFSRLNASLYYILTKYA